MCSQVAQIIATRRFIGFNTESRIAIAVNVNTHWRHSIKSNVKTKIILMVSYEVWLIQILLNYVNNTASS